MEQQAICSLVKVKEQCLYEYTKNKCSIIFTAYVVKNKMRLRKIATAVFKYDREQRWYPHVVEVIDSYQRKGVATVMYDIVQSEIDGTLVPSDDQSDAAIEFWKTRLSTERPSRCN